MRKTLLILLSLSFGMIAQSQNHKIDSLVNVLKTSKPDSNRVKVLNMLSAEAGWRIGNIDTSLYYAQKAERLAKKLKFDKGLSRAINNIGIVAYYQGKYHKALLCFFKALKINQKLGSSGKVATAYNSIGNIYSAQGNYAKSIGYYLKSLNIYEKMGYKYGIASAYNNIGNIYMREWNDSNALNMYQKSLAINKELKNKHGIAQSLNNIGIIYENLGLYKKSLDYHLKCLKILEELGDKNGIASSINNIGGLYSSQEKYQKAISYQLKALRMYRKIGSQSGIVNALNNIGSSYLSLNQPKKGKKYLKKALALAIKIDSKFNIKSAYRSLSEADSALGNFKSAYNEYTKYITYRDSLFNNENTKKITQLQMQFKFDQQQTADSIAHAKEKEIQQAKIAKKNAVIKAKQEQQYALFGGLLLVLVFAGFMYNRFKKTQRQKKIIEKQKAETEHQKQLVEIKNKEIGDSITYAKRIQEAILPSRYSLTENLKNGFVLFKPKDVVSGDFYWLEKQGGGTYFAAADCTGHGVPGAMVSVVCSNALSKALLEENIAETGKLLERVREIIAQQFSHSDENVRDGMDISLCKLEGNKLQWSGANNPLWIIRNNSREVEIVKPDKQPIGRSEKEQPFTTHNLTLNQGDSVYIFTDGYADQFGGTKNKKYKYKPLQSLLLSIAAKPMDEQKEILNQEFEDWKGDFEQIDDVCIIGMRI